MVYLGRHMAGLWHRGYRRKRPPLCYHFLPHILYVLAVYRGLLLACVQLLLALIFTVCAVQGHLFSRTTEPQVSLLCRSCPASLLTTPLSLQRIYPLVLSFVAAIAWLHGYISSYTYYTVPLTEFGVSSNDEVSVMSIGVLRCRTFYLQSVVRVCAEATLAERLSLLLGSGLSVLLVSFAV